MNTLPHKRSFSHHCYAWLVILICAAFLIYKYVMQVSPSVMAGQIMHVFHVHAAGLGNIAACFFYSYFITQLFVGVLMDRFSVRGLSSIAILISALGVWLFSSADALWEAGISRALMGIGAAFATVAYLKCAAMWFPKKLFAFIAGLLATFAMTGAIFGQAPLMYVINHLGWRHAMEYIAIFGVALALIFFLIIREGTQDDYLPQKVAFGDILKIFKNPQNWLLTFYSGLTFAPVAVFGGLWGPSFLVDAFHIPGTKAAFLTSLIFYGLAMGGPVLGLISDKTGKRKAVMLCGNVLLLVSLVSVVYLPLSHVMLGVALFSFGFGVGAFMLGFAVGKEINPLFLAATVVALINSGDAIFGAVTDPLVGWIMDLHWNGALSHGAPVYSIHDYRVAFCVLVAYVLVGTSLLTWIKTSTCKTKKQY